MHLVSPDAMREMDRRTIEEVGVPGPVLMDRAARGAVDALLDHFELAPGAKIGILCGTGNNGGDGLAMATMLAHRGHSPFVIVLGRRERLSDDARLYFDIAAALVDEVHCAGDDESLRQCLDSAPPCDLWCDALLGTGLDRPVEGRYKMATEFLHSRHCPVMAVDIPSGLDAQTGQVLGTAAAADLTATFGFAKCGQWLDPARRYCGRLVVVDIEIPDSVRDEVGVTATGLDRTWISGRLPGRARDIHKGAAGRTLHVGGVPETVGAISLSARAALVGGAGLITVATDERSQLAIPTSTPEIMARGAFDAAQNTVDEQGLSKLVDAADTVVIGPGLGTGKMSRRVLNCVIAAGPGRLIIDADALNLLSAHDSIRDDLADLATDSDMVLTPHPGEAARLLGDPVDSLLSNPIDAARRLAEHFHCTALFKSAATVVASHDGQVAISGTGNPGMATGGMGDALTGLLAAAFADFPEDPFLASCCAVTIHGLAGDGAVQSTGVRGLTVRRLLDEVPTVWQSLQG